MAVKHQIWESGYADLPGRTEDEAPKRRFIPSRAKIREAARASSTGGRFICPKCHVGFSVTFGRYGRFKTFEQPSHYCLDCSEEPGFVKC